MTRANAAVLALAVSLSVLVAGCGDEPDGRATTVTASPSTSASGGGAAADPTAAARAALASAGLTLPAGATEVTWTSTAPEHMTDGSLVTFSAATAEAEQMCRDAGLGPSLPAAALGPQDQQALQVASPPTGARICTGSYQQDLRWQRFVLRGPGDPTQVRVAVFRMPAR